MLPFLSFWMFPNLNSFFILLHLQEWDMPLMHDLSIPLQETKLRFQYFKILTLILSCLDAHRLEWFAWIESQVSFLLFCFSALWPRHTFVLTYSLKFCFGGYYIMRKMKPVSSGFSKLSTNQAMYTYLIYPSIVHIFLVFSSQLHWDFCIIKHR